MKSSGLTPERLAGILAKASGATIEPKMILDDVMAGAPADDEGKLNLFHYVAWLVKQETRLVR